MPFWHTATRWILLYHNNMTRLLMLKRVTIMLEEELVKKVRREQARLLQNSANSVSFSQVVSEHLNKSLKKLGEKR